MPERNQFFWEVFPKEELQKSQKEGKFDWSAPQSDMEKAADMADIFVLFFSAGANFWASCAENYDCRVLYLLLYQHQSYQRQC